MELLFLYLGICLLGYFIGTFFKYKNISIAWTGKIQTAMLIVLLFVMGARLGADKKVISSLGNIGLTSFILTVLIMFFSVLFVFIARRLLGINEKGVRKID